MDEVFNGVYLGIESDAGDKSLLRKHGVDTVISLTHNNLETGNITRVDVPMVDGPQNSYQAFAEAVETVVEQHKTVSAFWFRFSRCAGSPGRRDHS
jgi:hypothetical protein